MSTLFEKCQLNILSYLSNRQGSSSTSCWSYFQLVWLVTTKSKNILLTRDGVLTLALSKGDRLGNQREVYFINGFHYWLWLKSCEGYCFVDEVKGISRFLQAPCGAWSPCIKCLLCCSNKDHILGIAAMFKCCLELLSHAGNINVEDFCLFF